MKRALLLSLVSLSLASSSRSQVVGFHDPFVNMGVKVGANFEHIASAPLNGSIGPLAGVYVRKGIGRCGVRLEVIGSYAQYKTKYPAAYYVNHTYGMDTVTKGNFQVIYANVPLLFEYRATKKLSLMVGPQFSYTASITDKNKIYADVYGNSNIITKVDFSMALGAEYKVAKKMHIGARVMKGMLDVNNSTYYLTHKPWSSIGAQVCISYVIL